MGSITLKEARDVVSAGILHRLDSGDRNNGFGPQRVDLAIRFAGNDFAEQTHGIRDTTDVSLVAATSVVNFRDTAGMEQFNEQNFIWASIEGQEVEIAPLHTVQRMSSGLAAAGRPTMLAFEGPRRCWLYPIPDASYTLTVFWWQPFSTWTIGTDEPESVNLNLPTRYADGVLRLGASTAMRFSDPNTIYGSQGWAMYSQYRNDIAGQFRPDLQLTPPRDPTSHNKELSNAS